jgi:hypothetical protein
MTAIALLYPLLTRLAAGCWPRPAAGYLPAWRRRA